MNNVQNILHMVTNMYERLKLVEASLNEIMKINGKDAANMTANKSRVNDGGWIVEEVNHNFVDISSNNDKTICILHSDHDNPNDVLLDRHYNIGRNLMQIRTTNERNPSRYKLSPYDKRCGRTKNKFQVGPSEVSTSVSESDLNLIQFIFDPNLNKRFG
ncbi:hypothetical protein Q3G72_016054 [Acer saccharum]|nr:hypothetical protein Q3G72_016054 [Acer saccharum]